MTTSPTTQEFTQPAPERSLSQPARKTFMLRTQTWLACTVTVMVLFYIGVLDFFMGSRLSMDCGESIAITFIFTFSEVFAGFVNMPGGLWDTLPALVWTQYQYFFFLMIFGFLGCKLLLEDWRLCLRNTE